jgi:hypothetical protein
VTSDRITVRRTPDGIWLVRTPATVNYRPTWAEAVRLADVLATSYRKASR